MTDYKMTKEVGMKFYERYKAFMIGELDHILESRDHVEIHCAEDGETYMLYKTEIFCSHTYRDLTATERWNERYTKFMLEEFGEEFIAEVRKADQKKLDEKINGLKKQLEEIKEKE